MEEQAQQGAFEKLAQEGALEEQAEQSTFEELALEHTQGPKSALDFGQGPEPALRTQRRVDHDGLGLRIVQWSPCHGRKQENKNGVKTYI